MTGAGEASSQRIFKCKNESLLPVVQQSIWKKKSHLVVLLYELFPHVYHNGRS
jgi:hypothetical protein